MEDVHRAGGIPAILGELNRAGLLNREVAAVHAPSLQQWLDDWDIRGGSPTPTAVELFHAAPGGVRTTEPFSSANRWSSLDTDAAGGCIRDLEHAYSTEGGLAVLHGNLAEDGAIIKTAGVPEDVWRFEGPARVVESQEQAVSVILGKQIQPGDVLVVRYEGPAGGPGMQEMLHPTAFLKGSGPGRSARWSPTAASPVARRGSRSATSRRRRPPVARSGSSRRATGSSSTCASGPWSYWSSPECSPSGGPRWTPPSGRGSRWTGSVR